jgi:hypothetical protein
VALAGQVVSWVPCMSMISCPTPRGALSGWVANPTMGEPPCGAILAILDASAAPTA